MAIKDKESFVFYSDWISDLDELDSEMQDKVISEIARYGCGLPLKYTGDPIISTMAKMRFGNIDNVKAKYQAKVEQSKTGGRASKIDHAKIRELKISGKYTAQEIADMVGCSKSTVDKEPML